jgi:hypothetical protein
MKKYSALGQFFSLQKGERFSLSFEKIEKILGAKLPPSARKHSAWWANSQTQAHNWSRLWQWAGWTASAPDFDLQRIEFTRRSSGATAETLNLLNPSTKETLFDLLALIDISTAGWEFSSDHKPVRNIKSNPRFCYNWSFGSEREGYALCIWNKEMYLDAGRVVYGENIRQLAAELEADAKDLSNNSEVRNRAETQSRRARAFDEALRLGYLRGMPVSVFLTRGDMKERSLLHEGASHVQYRALDPIKWYVHEYDMATGRLLMVRGIPSDGMVNPEDTVPDTFESSRPDDVQIRAISIRRGQPEFREKLLAAYERKCVVTGCEIVQLLEAAHIWPHSEEPNYSVTNGLLLRADIHTLFDVRLLAIDSSFVVHVAPGLQSPYKELQGKTIRQPVMPGQFPNRDALNRRHLLFKKANPAASPTGSVQSRLVRAPAVSRSS